MPRTSIRDLVAATRPRQTELQAALAVLKSSIRALEQPHEPRLAADAEDLDFWAQHLDDLMEATRQYVRTAVETLGGLTSGGIDDETGGLTDAASDVVGAIRKSADRLRAADAGYEKLRSAEYRRMRGA